MSIDELPDDWSEADPALLLGVWSIMLDDCESKDEVVELGVAFAKQGVNIFRTMDQNPEITEEMVSSDIEVTDNIIEQFDLAVRELS